MLEAVDASDQSLLDFSARLSQLRQLLERLPRASSDIAAVASAKDLKQLRAAASQLASLQVYAAENPAALDPPVLAAVLTCVELLAQQLLEPCADLYSSYGGAPCETPAELQVPGTCVRRRCLYPAASPLHTQHHQVTLLSSSLDCFTWGTALWLSSDKDHPICVPEPWGLCNHSRPPVGGTSGPIPLQHALVLCMRCRANLSGASCCKAPSAAPAAAATGQSAADTAI